MPLTLICLLYTLKQRVVMKKYECKWVGWSMAQYCIKDYHPRLLVCSHIKGPRDNNEAFKTGFFI